MTALVARAPLHNISMSALQSGSRRLSARLQEKETSHPSANSGNGSSNGLASTVRSKKRKNDYEEEDDGFTFTRVKKNKRSQIPTERATEHDKPPTAPQPSQNEARRRISVETRPISSDSMDITEAQKKARRKKMSFSTPNPKLEVRRSKRLSAETSNSIASPVPVQESIKVEKRRKPLDQQQTGSKAQEHSQAEGETSVQPPSENMPELQHSSTKISLPFADTPVIRRNKAMREGRGSKGDRRSSLGLRGRRASSLIETGNSNALPHQEVDFMEFYKHIESDMMEPRRMRQLLMWCATRAMHPKPKGTDFEDASAKSAARVIEEELLKELANRSELSDWFSRADAPVAAETLPERPNPKNTQNAGKIAELEQQIERLRVEKHALEALLKPPNIPVIGRDQLSLDVDIVDKTLLSDEDVALLEALQSTSNLSLNIATRLGAVASTLGPTIDTFADNIHKIAQYRTAADTVASKVLSICASKISERERDGRRKALQTEEDRSPARDLSNVLRGLSKADR